MASERPILVLQHIACEPPAAYEDELRARGLGLQRVCLDDGDALPSAQQLAAGAYAGIIAMGGPMGTYDERQHPWLVAEKQLIAGAVRAGVPYWGVCLGAQMLAASLGARVAPGPLPEVGVGEVTLTEQASADPVFSGAPQAFQALHWHGDTYELPDGALRLARSARYEQAFVWGRAYGLQFHLEVTPDLAREWAQVPAYAQSLEQLMGAESAAQMFDEVERASASATALARELLGRWLELVVAP